MMSEDWKNQIEMIVFDVDGTLAETDDYYVEKMAVGIRRVLPFVPVEKAEMFVRPFINAGETALHSFYRLMDMIGLDTSISRLHSRFSVKGDYRYTEIKGMKDTLEKLHPYFQIGIITSGGHDSTRAFIEKFGLEDLICWVISAEDCRYIKPHPMPLLKISEAAGVPIQNCLMVGDTIFDIICAKRAGARSVAVRTGFDSGWILKHHHADLLIGSINEIPKILLKDQ